MPALRTKPPKKRNLAARALRSPLFRPRVAGDSGAYKRRRKFPRHPVDEAADES